MKGAEFTELITVFATHHLYTSLFFLLKHMDDKLRGFLQLFQQPVIKFTELLLHFSALADIIKHFITDWVVPMVLSCMTVFSIRPAVILD